MKTRLGDVTVNLCGRPAFMGREELALPMLLGGAHRVEEEAALGALRLRASPASCELNDLANTAVDGFMAGLGEPLFHRDPRRHFEFGRVHIGEVWERGWSHVGEIASELDELGDRYALFLQRSAAPFQDGFIRRCRFIAPRRLPDFHPRADVDAETVQEVTAKDALAEFLRRPFEPPDLVERYGDYYESADFRSRYGDDEQFSADYVVWLEQPGVLRAWTRMIYVPK